MDRPLSDSLAELCLAREDVARVAEFLDCDINGALEFARRIWLPDARQTVTRIARAILQRDIGSLYYLCDHLREGARTVGARVVITYAREIESTVHRRKWFRRECLTQRPVA